MEETHDMRMSVEARFCHIFREGVYPWTEDYVRKIRVFLRHYPTDEAKKYLADYIKDKMTQQKESLNKALTNKKDKHARKVIYNNLEQLMGNYHLYCDYIKKYK